MQAGTPGALTPKVGGFNVDLSPILKNDVIANPQRYAYPACAMTVRFSAMMRLADYPCLSTSEPVTATLMTNIIALNKTVAAAPHGSARTVPLPRSWTSGTAPASGKRPSDTG